MTQKIESWSSDNQKINENEKNQQDQISQIAKLISAHVSEILIQRLNLEEDSQQYRPRSQNDEKSSNGFSSDSPSQKYKTPEMCRKTRSQCRQPRKSNDIRFHSEYRLNRTARPTETPLENRAFQLRRKSLEARKAELTSVLSM